MEIGAAIKQQMLSVLIDALGQPGANAPGASKPAGSPATSPTSGRDPASLLALPVGARIAATVAAVTPQGGIMLKVGDQLIRADASAGELPAQARRPGASLVLRVETTGSVPRLSIQAVESPAPGARPATLTPGAAPPASAALPIVQPAVIATAPPVLPSAASPAAPPEADIVEFPLPTPVRDSSAPERGAATRGPPADPAILASVLRSAAASAAPRQGSAAPLFADLAALAARGDAPLPRAAEVIAQALLRSRLDGERPATPEAIKEAVGRFAVSAEAVAARGEPPALDFKSLILTLRALLPESDRRAAPVPDAEPPHRDGAAAALRPALPRIGPNADTRALTATLAGELDQAAGRAKLHQLASLPEPRTNDVQRQLLSFDLPIAFGPQTALAGFRIERERRRGQETASGAVDVWGVRFAINADGMGPVHAQLKLAGGAVSVRLWAEEPATRAAFAAALPSLEAALADSALDIGELTVMAGRPAEPRADAGRFLDRSS